MLHAGLTNVAASRANIALNRYSNILPLDSHRLVLPHTGPIGALRAGKTDYINATRFEVRGPLLGHCALLWS